MRRERGGGVKIEIFLGKKYRCIKNENGLYFRKKLK
jgi:hypothetical protein